MATPTVTSDLPEELRNDTAWRAALHILESVFPTDPRVWIHISAGEEWGINFEAMLAAGTWSGAERTLLRATAAIFDSDKTVSLWEVAGRLDNNSWNLFLEALSILRETH